LKPSAWTLWLSAFGGAAAWTAAVLIVPTLGSAACIAGAAHTARFDSTWWILLVATAVAFVAACWALVVTVNSIRKAPATTHPDRTRFMAFGGLLMNVVFLVGLAFFGVGVVLVPVCR